VAKQTERREPAGFTTHNSGLASERAREQGWQTNAEERTRMPQGKQNEDGGTDYDYGAQDFGDEPVDTSSAQPAPVTPKKERRPTAKPRSKKAA
jgi:hypothetical protein